MIALQDHLEHRRIPQLVDLFGSTWWAAGRMPSDVEKMLKSSDLVLALVDTAMDNLVGFTRVLTDFTYLAMVLDVVVAPGKRQQGLGQQLLEAVISQPRLSEVRSIELVCQPELVPFYHRWGFSDQVGRSLLMRRTATTALIPDA